LRKDTKDQVSHIETHTDP